MCSQTDVWFGFRYEIILATIFWLVKWDYLINCFRRKIISFFLSEIWGRRNVYECLEAMKINWKMSQSEKISTIPMPVMCTRASKEITRVKYHNLFHISSRILTVQMKMCDMFSVSLTKLDELNNMYIDTSFLCSCWCSTFSMHRDAWIMMMNIVFLLSFSFSLSIHMWSTK